jgi:hypothetical protein
MKIFPESNFKIDLSDNMVKTLDNLKKETLSDEQFIVNWGDKPFIGTINENSFEIKQARKVYGSLWIIHGFLENKHGTLKVQVSKKNKIIFGGFFLFVISGLIISLIRLDLKIIFQTFMLIIVSRFLFLEFGFRLTSKNGIKKLTKIIGITKLEENKR